MEDFVYKDKIVKAARWLIANTKDEIFNFFKFHKIKDICGIEKLDNGSLLIEYGNDDTKDKLFGIDYITIFFGDWLVIDGLKFRAVKNNDFLINYKKVAKD